MLIRDTCETARAIVDGEHDADLDYIQGAVQARRKMMFRRGARVRLTGTRNPEIEGQTGTVVKVNAKRVTVDIDESGEFNVPTTMLELV